MADHSSQIGTEKVLLIVGIAVEDLPQPGKALGLDDLKVLAIVPGKKWKKESERFGAFLAQVGLTRHRTQQTELSHFAPPALKQKSRFMNLGPLLKWSAMVLHHLGDPQSQSRAEISAARMQEKLGLMAQLIRFVWRSEQRLGAGQRAWLSTEVLESLFGRFKRLEGQHSKGGFTGLLAALPTLCSVVDRSLVRQRFSEVDTPALKRWKAATLGQTLTARRTAAYQESKSATNGEFFQCT